MLKSKRYGKVLFSSALMQIFLLVMATVAISFVLGSEMKSVSALELAEPDAINVPDVIDDTFIDQVDVNAAPPTNYNIAPPQQVGGTVSKGGIGLGNPEVAGGGTGQFSVRGIASGKYTFGVNGATGQALGYLAQGLLWGAGVAMLVQFLGPMFGLSKENTNALSTAAIIVGVGAGVAKIIAKQWFTGNTATLQWTFGLSFIAITAIVFILMYKDTKKHIVNVQCLPWEPQLGGAKCDDCNKDPLRPCSEYRCKSLGQACDIVNKGTAKEQCVWISKGDVNSPTITPWDEPLTRDLKYTPLAPKSTRPTALGVQIIGKGENKNCLPAYTPLQFGVTTNEPAQCKWGLSSTENYTGSMYFMEEGNYYVTNHTLKFKMPSPKDQDGNTQPYFQNDGTFNYYLRCQDANG